MTTPSSDDLDGEHTDELPVLRDTVVLDDGAEPLLGTSLGETTGEHTVMYGPLAAARDDSPRLLAELANQVPALEAQIRTLTDLSRDLEQAGAAKDRRIAELEATVAALRKSLEDSAAAERRAAVEAALRDGRLAELKDTVERLQTEAAERRSELEELRAQTGSARVENEALRAELAARPAPAPARRSSGHSTTSLARSRRPGSPPAG